jgi:adenine-specific DNA-methyltransferase
MANDIEKLLDEIKTLRQENKKLNNAIKHKKFGIVWMDIPEAFEEESVDKIPLLEEKKDLQIKSKNKCVNEPHILLEGDNFHSLTCLNYTHRNSIDIIYIDPPYNTGGDDFHYKDKRVLDKYPDGKVVDKDDPLRHSKWLSFMSKRLELSKNLLNKEGVIFISIGEDELANLKLLCNQIFKEKNFLGLVSRVQKRGSDLGDYFKPTVDYVLAYAKNKTNIAKFKIGVDESKFKKIEMEGPRKGEFYEDSKSLYQSSLRDIRPNQKYPIECPDGTLVLPPYKVFDEIHREGEGRWRWTKDTYLEKKDSILVFKKTKNSPLMDQNGKKSAWNIYTKRYLKDAQKKGNVPSNIFEEFLNSEATKELGQLELSFSYPKPTSLIKHLIKITQKQNNIKILDFFAGSGTTGQAVLELNEIDQGSRQFILCTNNENNICRDVTLERMKRLHNPAKYIPTYKIKNQRNEEIKNEIKSLKEKLKISVVDEINEELKELKELKKSYPTKKSERLSKNLEEEYQLLLTKIRNLTEKIISKEEDIKEIQQHNKKIVAEINKLEKKIINLNKPLDFSLKYYTMKFAGSAISHITDDDKIAIAYNAGELVAISENIMFETLKNNYSQFFVNSTQEECLAIYFDEDLDMLDEFKENLKNQSKSLRKSIVYMFSWGTEDYSYLFDDFNLDVIVKPIPQPILEIYKKIYKAEK